MSIRCFQEAIESDPHYAQPYAGMADAYLTLMDYGHMPQPEATAKARAMVLKAIELDESLAEAHTSLGHAAFHDFDWPTAERELLRGIELNPSYSTARFYYANYLAAMARLDAAVHEAEQSTRLDPVSPTMHSNLASMLWFAGNYERSIEQAQRSLELNPSFSPAYVDLGRAHEQLGAFDRAIKAFRKAVSLEQRAHSLASLAHAYAISGRRDAATKILRRLQQTARKEFIPAYNFALIFMGLGKTDETFQWLDKAYEERSGALTHIRVNPRFASVRRDPRFVKLLQRVGLV